MSDRGSASTTAWPSLPSSPDDAQPDFAKALYQTQLTDYAARLRDPVNAAVAGTALLASRRDTSVAADDALRKDIQAAYVAVMQGSLDRSIKRAEFLNTASAAIATTYTALLGLLYSAKDRPLQAWALEPVFFLALAFVFGLIYVSFVNRKTDDRKLIPSGVGGELAEKRLEDFLQWVSLGVMRRAWALRTAVVSIAVGVSLLPIPFVALPDWLRIGLLLLGSIAVLITPFAGWAYRRIRALPDEVGVELPLLR